MTSVDVESDFLSDFETRGLKETVSRAITSDIVPYTICVTCGTVIGDRYPDFIALVLSNYSQLDRLNKTILARTRSLDYSQLPFIAVDDLQFLSVVNERLILTINPNLDLQRHQVINEVRTITHDLIPPSNKYETDDTVFRLQQKAQNEGRESEYISSADALDILGIYGDCDTCRVNAWIPAREALDITGIKRRHLESGEYQSFGSPIIVPRFITSPSPITSLRNSVTIPAVVETVDEKVELEDEEEEEEEEEKDADVEEIAKELDQDEDEEEWEDDEE